MIKNGIVMKIEKNTATIMSSNGSFYKITFIGKSPQIGQEFFGEVIIKTRFLNKNLVAAACILFTILFGGLSFAYYTPASTIEVNINPSMQIKTNIFNRIIFYKPLNNDGKQLLASVNLTHKLLDDGLKEIIEQSKKANFINNSYVKNRNTIQVKILTSNNQKVALPKFEKEILANNLKADIVSDGIVTHIENDANPDNSSNTTNPSSSTNTSTNAINNTTNSASNSSNNYQNNNTTSSIPNGLNNNENSPVNNDSANNSFKSNNTLQHQPINNSEPAPNYNTSINNDSRIKPSINDSSKDKPNIIPNNSYSTNDRPVPKPNKSINNGALITPVIPMNNFSNNNFLPIPIPNTNKRPKR